MVRSLLAASLVVVLAAVGHAQPAPATPNGTDVELAKAHYHTGEIYYARGRFADAAREFEEAYRLSSRAELLYNMGKSYDGPGNDPTRALHAYRRFVAALPTSPDRPEVDRRIAVLEQTVGRIEITSNIDGSQVLLDGDKLGATPLLPAVVDVNPGQHKIEVSAEGNQTFRTTVTVEKNQRLQVAAELKSLVKIVQVEVEHKVPLYKKWWLWTTIVGVLVVAGAVTGGVLASQKKSTPDGLVLPGVKNP